MPITRGAGNLLTQEVDALVNTVNTEGIMGKGIALQFKRAWPAMFRDYEAACKRGEVTLGRMHRTDRLPGEFHPGSARGRPDGHRQQPSRGAGLRRDDR